MKKRKLPKTHKVKGVSAIVRYDIDGDEFWLDLMTISSVPQESIATAKKAERELPRYYKEHPAVGLYRLNILANLAGEL